MQFAIVQTMTSDIKSELSAITMVIRVSFNPQWSILQQIADIAKKHGGIAMGGSAESGQAFFRLTGFSIGAFRKDCSDLGVQTHFN